MTIDRTTLRWNGWGPVNQENADASDTSLEERVEALEAKADEEKPFQRGDL